MKATLKKPFYYILLMCIACLALPLMASTQKVYDTASLLSKEQIKELEDKIAYLSNLYKVDIGIVTTRDLEGKTTMSYADDFYDNTPYASDGLLLLIGMQNRVPIFLPKDLLFHTSQMRGLKYY